MSSDTDASGIEQIEVYPPGDWSPRPEPTAEEIDSALEKAAEWWPYAVNHGDECIESFLDLFERYLSGEVRRRGLVEEDPGQRTLVTDGGTTETEEKEEHRLGTIGQWDVPDADWARSYDWTRYRGPDVYPVPGRWVLSMTDGDGTSWYYFEDGDGKSKSSDIDIDAEPLATALLFFRRDGDASIREEPDVEWEFSIDGTEIFRRVNPDRDDGYGSIARALSAYHRGQDPGEIAAKPDSGRKPDDVREQEELERKQEENESLRRWSN